MSNSTKEKLPIDWRSMVAGAVLGSLITGGIFVIPSAVVNNSWPRWSNWTGLGEDTITKKSTERTGGEAAPISKVTFTDEPQPGKTLWDVLGLAGVVAVPFVLFKLGVQVQARDRERVEEQAKLERDIADDRLRDEALQAYIDSMAELLLDRERRKETSPDGGSSLDGLASIRTVTILRRLEGDTERQRRVLRFLRDAKLFESSFRSADLSGIDLRYADLRSADLSGTDLSSANLSGAKLGRADLLRGAARVRHRGGAPSPNQTNLTHANLSGANLSGADLREAKLFEADLIGANLIGADLSGADLSGGTGGADLSGANLSNAKLSGASLARTPLHDTNLTGADLKDAKWLMPEQVKAAKNWREAHYSPGFRKKL
jgi:uncharacterized protein YjbI with pentapeptide repeats